MSEAAFRFYAQLNYFFPAHRRTIGFTHTFDDSPSIKDMIESLGVPHTEVKLMLVNGTPVDFSYRVQDGDRISVYPAFSGIDIAPLTDNANGEAAEIRFILDVHLGRLAAYLRMLGF